MWKFNQTKEECEREVLNPKSGAENDVTREDLYVFWVLVGDLG
jgi:hypothetical protein